MSELSADVPENWEQIKEVAAVLAKTADYGTGVTVTEFAQAEAVLNHLHPSPPTREQIAVDLIEKLRKTGGVPIDSIWARWRQLFREYDDAVLALLQKGAER